MGAWKGPGPDTKLSILRNNGKTYSGQDHCVSIDPKCEGLTAEELLGYVLP
jgi:hypothetical protein